MTDWKEYKKRRPLRGDIQRGYEDAQEAMGVGYLILNARAAAGLTQAQVARRSGPLKPWWPGGSPGPRSRACGL